MLYDEWENGLEDKLVWFRDAGGGATEIVAGSYPFNANTLPQAVVTVAPNVWHHFAYVYDGAEERLYLDGVRIKTQPRTSAIANSAGVGHIGALLRPDLWPSFQGYMESIRLSDIPRYSGESFSPPTGDFTSDANTLLLYTFDELAGSLTVADSSPLGRTGTLGAGFAGATAPLLAPRPVAGEPPATGPRATLGMARPNPFSATTELVVSVSAQMQIQLTLFDATGREVRVLLNEQKPIGRHRVELDARGLAPGVYFIRLTADGASVQSHALVFSR